MIRYLTWLALVVALATGCVIAASVVVGCKSASPSRYVAPRVEGKVLDAQTRQPIRGVAVRRIDPGADGGAGEIPHGALALEQPLDIRTRKDGSFVVASKRDLELFGRTSWYSITFNFKHPGYTSFTTNYTPANATPTASGEPLVKTGEILLSPLSR